MIFKEKSKDTEYTKYSKEKDHVKRQVKLKTDVAEDLNRIIAVFNQNYSNTPIYTSEIVNILLRCYIYQLAQDLTEKEILNILHDNAIPLYYR